MNSLNMLKFVIIGGGIGMIAIISILFFAIDRPEPEEIVLKDIEFNVKDFIISKNENITEVSVTFSFMNPNTRTLILETLNYELYVDDKRVAFGSIGEKLEGLFSSSGKTYILPPGISLDEIEKATIDDVFNDKAKWRIKGNYVIIEPQRESGKEYTFDLLLTQ